jgi:asparagine synthase (glutamine-hydrolysing)
MCGIIGINWKDEESVRYALGLFKYRGPDASGVFCDEEITLGHNRLSIIDVDARANQPMWDEAGEIAIVFNGEIYNFKELQKELSGKYHFRTESDTEALLYAYREYGEDLGSYLRGMFAFAIYDKNKSRLCLFRDHMGIKPLYYAYKNGFLSFSSELKGLTSLFSVQGVGLEPDPGAL